MSEEDGMGPAPPPQVLWLNVPRPEEVFIVFVVFALIVYVLFITMLGGHLMALLMAGLSSTLACGVIVGLGRISRIIADRRKTPRGGGAAYPS